MFSLSPLGWHKKLLLNFFQTGKKTLRQSPASLAQLAPFIDPNLLRFGGRLQFSSLSDDDKHPILLPSNAFIYKIINPSLPLKFLIWWTKFKSLHDCTQILDSIRLWRHSPIYIFMCTRYKTNYPRPFMDDLPSIQVQPHRPFLHVGMDYGGPFIVKESHRRNSRTSKIYLANFICMSVKKGRLEIVSDLSTNAFLTALDHCVAHRGIPVQLYSDCGTNYVEVAHQGQLRVCLTILLYKIKSYHISHTPGTSTLRPRHISIECGRQW